MFNLQIHSPECLLQILQHFKKSPTQFQQIHSLLITNGFLLKTEKWTNTLLFNALIRSYINHSKPQTALRLFTHMLHHEAPPNSHTFPSLVKAISTLSPIIVYSVNGQCVKRGLINDPFVRTSFLSVYSQFGDFGSAHKMFDDIAQPCIVSYNAMLDAYVKNGDMDSAMSMFVKMSKKDVYSWTSVINGYVKNGCFKEAICYFKEMMGDKDMINGVLRPNEATFVSVLSSCASVDDGCALHQGKQIHGYIVRNEKKMSVFIGTALIAFYGKMACLNYASNVFNTMDVKEVCTWNAIICSLASNCMGNEALEMFEIMKSRKFLPNEVTFVGILTACARTKLVDLGLELFHSMSVDFGVEPKMEHYGCVVDLLGRAGLLKEAFEFVKSMPFKADASVLGALLGACRLHGAVELGKEVGKCLIELQPRHCGRYVLLSSIYFSADKWDHAAALRSSMVSSGIHKIPAFSI